MKKHSLTPPTRRSKKIISRLCGTKSTQRVGWLTIGALAAAAPWAQNAPRPNIILVMTDDQGYGDLSCHGNPRLKPPQIDRLYTESVRLTDYHVSSTCASTRAAVMPGSYPNRTGVWHTINGRSILRRNETAPSSSTDRTAIFGKWHLGDKEPLQTPQNLLSEAITPQ